MDEAVKELTHFLLQGGGDVHRRAAYHPPQQRNLQYVFNRNGGSKQRTDMDRRFDLAVEQGIIQPDDAVESIAVQRARFNRRKRKYAWLEHHSRCTVKRGKCKWEQCPGRDREELTDRDRAVRKSYLTHYKCVQCSMKFGKDHYFCNDFSNNDTRNCHDLYHKKYHGKDVDT